MLDGDDLGGCYCLAHMALGMLGHVDEQTTNGGGPTLSTYFSDVAQSSGIEGANSFDALLEGRGEFRKQLVLRSAAIEFGAQGGNLLCCEGSFLGVGEQPVHAAGDVANMERERRDSERPGIELVVTQAAAPAFNILLGQL